MSKRIEEMLRQSIGLNVESISRNKVDADILLRMRACGITEREVYANLLKHSSEEMKQLIETVTVPETWFFRVPGSFARLEDVLTNCFNRERKYQPVRILSIPCSTGEEPYSIAMTCYECGYSKNEFIINATDISEICLKKAREAVYTKNSFRGVRQKIIDTYFTQSNNLYELDRKIVDSVHFFQSNVLEFTPPSVSERYDIIFCRNMLIYFEPESQQKVISLLEHSLRDDGFFFAGHSEAGVFFNSPFSPLDTDGSFTFVKTTYLPKPPQKTAAEAPKPNTDTVPDIFSKPTLPPSAKRRRRQTAAAEMLKSATPSKPEKTTIAENDPDAVRKQELEQAEKLAGSGELELAEAICAKCLEENKLDHQAYCLMGMIKLSGKHYDEAENYFNKALYLNPDYYEALLSIAILHERSGNPEAARTFRLRAGKIKL